MKRKSKVETDETDETDETEKELSNIKSGKKKKIRDDEKFSSENVWLMKSEPETRRLVKGKDVKFSIDDLKEMGKSSWDGVRNYEARNIMRDKMKIGDLVLFYHSNIKQPGIAGLARICNEAHVDTTAFDQSHPYYDPKSSPDNPKWFMVDVEFVSKLKRVLTLDELKQYKMTTSNHVLKDMILLNRGRLSVQPVSHTEFKFIKALIDEIGFETGA